MRLVIGLAAVILTEIVLLAATGVCVRALRFARRPPPRFVIVLFGVLGIAPLVVLPALVAMYLLGVSADVRVPIGRWTARVWVATSVAYVAVVAFSNRK